MIAGVVAVARRIDPSREPEEQFLGAGDRHVFGLRDILRSARDRQRERTRRKMDCVPVCPIDLRLKEEIGGEALRDVRIDSVELVSNQKPRGRGLAVLVVDSKPHGVGSRCREQDVDVVAESDVL
jgi:hypothetical protein